MHCTHTHTHTMTEWHTMKCNSFLSLSAGKPFRPPVQPSVPKRQMRIWILPTSESHPPVRRYNTKKGERGTIRGTIRHHCGKVGYSYCNLILLILQKNDYILVNFWFLAGSFKINKLFEILTFSKSVPQP